MLKIEQVKLRTLRRENLKSLRGAGVWTVGICIMR